MLRKGRLYTLLHGLNHTMSYRGRKHEAPKSVSAPKKCLRSLYCIRSRLAIYYPVMGPNSIGLLPAKPE